MKEMLIAVLLAYVLWTVAYLIWERRSRRSSGKQPLSKPIPENQNDDDIIGKGTFLMSHLMPQAASLENQRNGTQMNGSFAASSETKPPVKVPDDQLDEAFSHHRDNNQPMDIDVPLEYENDEQDNLDEEEEDAWLSSNSSLADGSSFEELGAAVRTIVHYQTATLPEKEQAGGILLKIRQTDMFEQLVQSAPWREDQVSQAINLHLSDYYRKMAEQGENDTKDIGKKNNGRSTGESEVPPDFNIKNFV
ncbi:MAG TPA: hypothetical protein DHV48_13710 [Prolixibacteraceae bacterium]|nr:hypothetical protein [Prolixibacteraceae bacterium]